MLAAAMAITSCGKSSGRGRGGSNNGPGNGTGDSNDTTTICIAGHETHFIPNVGGKPTIAMYWQNGVAQRLTDETHDADAHAIAAAGKDIYVAGYEYNSHYKVAKLWKNGHPTAISDGTSDADILAIAISGSDIYLAGI